MIQERTAEQCALDTVVYAKKLAGIFFGCDVRDGTYQNEQADYAVHKEGMPHNESDPNCWISTPSIPIYIETLFNRASKEQSIALAPVLEQTVQVLEQIANQSASDYKASARNIVDSTKSVLPNLRHTLETMREPQVV